MSALCSNYSDEAAALISHPDPIHVSLVVVTGSTEETGDAELTATLYALNGVLSLSRDYANLTIGSSYPDCLTSPFTLYRVPSSA